MTHQGTPRTRTVHALWRIHALETECRIVEMFNPS
jgi:hypothetical protein